jgi:hypothetical protein
LYPARDATRERDLSIMAMFFPALSASFFIASLLTIAPHPSNAQLLQGGLVAADRGRFVLEDGSTFRVAGTNCYYLAYSSGAEDGSYEHAWVDEVLDEAQALKLNVVRVWSVPRRVVGAREGLADRARGLQRALPRRARQTHRRSVAPRPEAPACA